MITLMRDIKKYILKSPASVAGDFKMMEELP
jgi:hypothetical protein